MDKEDGKKEKRTVAAAVAPARTTTIKNYKDDVEKEKTICKKKMKKRKERKE